MHIILKEHINKEKMYFLKIVFGQNMTLLNRPDKGTSKIPIVPKIWI